MGSTLTKEFSGSNSGKDMTILMAGLVGAGKTTIMHTMKLDEMMTPVDTKRPDVEIFEDRKIKLTVLDIGGRNTDDFDQFTKNVRALIFVVDSSDKEALRDASKELFALLQKDDMRDAFLLLVANKQDLPNAMATAEVSHVLRLDALRDTQWYAQGTFGLNGEGLYDGLKRLTDALRQS